MVVLSKIYTKTGDGGRTRLTDMTEVSKNDLRVEAYGDVDEANAAIGVALATGQLPDEVAAVLSTISNEMFDVGADLSNPLRPLGPDDHEPLRVTQAYVDRLETWCDRFGDELPTLRSFILPGGSLAAAQLHVARTVTRRAERAGWAAVDAHGTEESAEGDGGVNVTALLYLNRLSDLLFILIRVVNGPEGDILWVPCGDRVHD
ncbi:cob(I)yrinic acid a,c-diamide adenosyltransferase [Microlunatus flavus]|uniref:Corrinoid adenosyltransferase n=1 Tax=Microlunatus flavus TaxID=1036181 RepID=A0A1H9F2X2_9ACTN|nr:cob(I)yrinic acid a,c-diamide adenosyltransferase [Microlunatus flavus]SEQ32237.1 cob(I)alamin adenosyltransferase [Microlunatus flavus]